MPETTLIFDPTVRCADEPQQLRRTLDSLDGKVVGFIDNRKPNFHYLVDDIAQLLMEKYGVVSVIKRAKPATAVAASEAVMKELTAECDLVITGSGD
jgi:hypothetical protein